MKKLIYSMIVLSMVSSVVFLSEAISSNNPLSVQAQSYQTEPQYQPTKPTYKPGRRYHRPRYRWIRVRRCRWIRVHKCWWVRIRVRIPRYYRPGYRNTGYRRPTNTYQKPPKTY